MSLSKLLVQSLVARARRRRTGVPREGDSLCTVGRVGAISRCCGARTSAIAMGKLVYRHTRFGRLFSFCMLVRGPRWRSDGNTTMKLSIRNNTAPKNARGQR